MKGQLNQLPFLISWFKGAALSAFGRLIPLLTAIVVVFAAFQLYTAIMFLVNRDYGFGAFNLVFSFAGFALARALWTNRRKLM